MLATALTRYGTGLNAFAYTNPLVIAQASGMVLMFSHLKLGVSSLINRIAMSAFAVYLFHNNAYVFPYYQKLCQTVYDNFSGIWCLAVMFAAMAGVYATATIIDQLRIVLWRLTGHVVVSTTERMWQGVWNIGRRVLSLQKKVNIDDAS